MQDIPTGDFEQERVASLVNYEKSEAPYSYFPNMQSSEFWSSSSLVNSRDSAWGVDFNTGGVGSLNKRLASYVRCVRNAD